MTPLPRVVCMWFVLSIDRRKPWMVPQNYECCLNLKHQLRIQPRVPNSPYDTLCENVWLCTVEHILPILHCLI